MSSGIISGSRVAENRADVSESRVVCHCLVRLSSVDHQDLYCVKQGGWMEIVH